MAIPNELNKDINAIPEPTNRVLIRSLIFAVILLGGGMIALYKSGIGDKQSAVAEAKEQAKIYKTENDYLKAELKIKDRELKIKDSLYNDCGNKRLEDAFETKESIRRRLKNTSEIKKLVKTSK